MVTDEKLAETGATDTRGAASRVLDPSDAVTGLGFIFGLVGAVIGIAAAIFLSNGIGWGLIGYCFLAALAGGSAGVVTGGMIGAVIAVLRGVTRPPARTRPFASPEELEHTDTR
jgi:hypothetical protein